MEQGHSLLNQQAKQQPGQQARQQAGGGKARQREACLKFSAAQAVLSSCHITRDQSLILAVNCDPIRVLFHRLVLYERQGGRPSHFWRIAPIGCIEIPCPGMRQLCWVPGSDDLLALVYERELSVLRVSGLSSTKLAFQEMFFYRAVSRRIEQIYWSEAQRYLAILERADGESPQSGCIQLVDFYSKKTLFEHAAQSRICSCKFEGLNLAVLYESGSIDGIFIKPGQPVQVKNLIYMKTRLTQNICWSLDSRVFCSESAPGKLKLWSHAEKQVRELRDEDAATPGSLKQEPLPERQLHFLNLEIEYQKHAYKDYFLCIGNSQKRPGWLSLLRLAVGKQQHQVPKICCQVSAGCLQKVQSFPYVTEHAKYILFIAPSVALQPDGKLLRLAGLMASIDDLVCDTQLGLQQMLIQSEQEQVLDYAPGLSTHEILSVDSQDKPPAGNSLQGQRKLCVAHAPEPSSVKLNQQPSSAKRPQGSSSTKQQPSNEKEPHSNQSSDKILKYMTISKTHQMLETLKQNQKKQGLKFVNQINFSSIFGKKPSAGKEPSSARKRGQTSQAEDISDAECAQLPYTGNDDIENVNLNSNHKSLQEQTPAQPIEGRQGSELSKQQQQTGAPTSGNSGCKATKPELNAAIAQRDSDPVPQTETQNSLICRERIFSESEPAQQSHVAQQAEQVAEREQYQSTESIIELFQEAEQDVQAKPPSEAKFKKASISKMGARVG